MQEKNELFRGMLAKAGENYMKSGNPNSPESTTAGEKLNYLLLAILLFVGSDAMKLIFRTNFGSSTISLLRFGIASVVFFLWAVICALMGLHGMMKNEVFGMAENSFNGVFGGSIGLLITAIFYLILAFYTFSVGSIQEFIEERRPPAHLRDEVDLGYSFDNQVVEIFEIRQRWDNKNEKVRTPVAKTRWVKSRNFWKIYWMRGSGKWELYKPQEEVKNLAEFFEIISEDKYGCFWG